MDLYDEKRTYRVVTPNGSFELDDNYRSDRRRQIHSFYIGIKEVCGPHRSCGEGW